MHLNTPTMRILIVEDEIKISNFLKKSLEAECFAVDVGHDGEEGVKLAKLNEYDLIILDNIMPKKTGLEMCKELRNEGYNVPILLLSVQDDTNLKVLALDAGVDDYLTKPFSLSELLARARALLRRPQIIEQEVLTYNNLYVDTKKHIVIKDEEEITLTRKEFMLLSYLMQNQGIVLSRGMIMEHVWDINADPFSNTIETHVTSLRKKIGDLEHGTYITTVSGCGYRFGTAEWPS